MSSNVLVQAVEDVPFGVVIAWIAGAVAIVMALFAIGKKVYALLEKYRKKRNDIDEKEIDFDKLKKSEEEMHHEINAITAAVQQLLADRLNQRIRYYYKIGYIPHDELENFQHQYTAYKGVDGNGEMELRFHKCLEDLHVVAEKK